MKTITAKQAKEIDSKATQGLGISTLILMENAGIRIADFILGILRPDKAIAVFCGKGNNAGDGLVVARQLLCEGVKADIFLLAGQDSLSPEARENFDILKKITGKIYQIKAEKDLQRIKFSCYSLLIDALFGIGLRGEVSGIFKAAIRKMNLSGKTIVSIDIPSGLDADSGYPLGAAVKADYTISLIAPKKGLLINQGPEFAGRLITRHIGFPAFSRRQLFSKRRDEW